MIRKAVTYLILVPLAILILMFASANRQTVTVSFDPFNAMDPAFSVAMPLFVLAFILVILGVLIGGCAAWLRQSRHRRSARLLEREVRVLRGENEVLTRAAPPDSARLPYRSGA